VEGLWGPIKVLSLYAADRAESLPGSANFPQTYFCKLVIYIRTGSVSVIGIFSVFLKVGTVFGIGIAKYRGIGIGIGISEFIFSYKTY